MPTQIHVLVWGPANLTRAIVLRLLAREPDFTVTAPPASADRLHAALSANRPRVVILIGEDPHNVADCADFLDGKDPGTVLVLTEDGRTMHHIRAMDARTTLGAASPELLVARIRAAAR